MVSQLYLVTFSIGQFKDTIISDVSPLDCFDLLHGKPYQAQRNSIYMAKYHEYKLPKYGHTYILIAANIQTHFYQNKNPSYPSELVCVSLFGVPHTTKKYYTSCSRSNESSTSRVFRCFPSSYGPSHLSPYRPFYSLHLRVCLT